MAAKRSLKQLREWLDLSEAVRYLASRTDAEVTRADLLRHGLDGQLRLSVLLVNPRRARIIYPEDLVDPLVGRWPPPDTTLSADGVFDLPLIGGERLAVERAYHDRT